MSDLKLLLRDPKDIGEKRTLLTPNPDQLVVNTDPFIKTWGAEDGKS